MCIIYIYIDIFIDIVNRNDNNEKQQCKLFKMMSL